MIYDDFNSFPPKFQNAFIKIAKRNKERYFILDNSKDTKDAERIILNMFIKALNK